MQFRAPIQSSHSVYSLCPKFKITILTTSIRDGLSSLAYHNFAFATGKQYCELSDNGHKDLSNGCPKKLVAELPFNERLPTLTHIDPGKLKFLCQRAARDQV
eukprot:520758_1